MWVFNFGLLYISQTRTASDCVVDDADDDD